MRKGQKLKTQAKGRQIKQTRENWHRNTQARNHWSPNIEIVDEVFPVFFFFFFFELSPVRRERKDFLVNLHNEKTQL